MSSNRPVTFADQPSPDVALTHAPTPPPQINAVPPEAVQLVGLAVDGLAACAREQDPNQRFAGAQLAALRAAAALVAVRSRTSSDPQGMTRGRALNVWQLLARVARSCRNGLRSSTTPQRSGRLWRREPPPSVRAKLTTHCVTQPNLSPQWLGGWAFQPPFGSHHPMVGCDLIRVSKGVVSR